MFNQYNAFSIIDIWVFFKEYIGAGGLISMLFIFMTALYLKGMSNHYKQEQQLAEDGFSIESKKFKISTSLFHGVNKLLDVFVGKWLAFIHKYTWKKTLSILDKLFPDSAIEKVVGLNKNIQERVDYMNQEFPVKENNFWHHKERVPDAMEISPIICGRWFNGKKVENYLHAFISPRSFYIVVKSGLLVAFLTFLVLGVLYHPEKTYGYQPASVEAKLIEKYEQVVAKDPSLLPQYRTDVWDIREAKQRMADAQQNAQQYAKELFANAQRYNYHSWGWIFKNGNLTALFLAMAVGLAFTRKSYFNSFRLARIPYIKDTHEEFKYEFKKDQIDTYKRNLSSLNLRGTGFDRNSPLIKFGRSSGLMEKKGFIGAYRKDAQVYQSTLDLSQNTILFGATGTGKSRSTIIPFAKSIFQLKSMYLNNEVNFNNVFDVRTNSLTQRAVEEGYLDEYKALPHNPTVISCAIMDIKSQLWKDLWPYAEKCYLQDTFAIIGAFENEGQYSIDLLNGLTPQKLTAFLSSMVSQMGGKDERDFWSESALNWIKAFSYVAHVYSRTPSGEQYMEEKLIKIWSLAFIYELVVLDSNQELFSKCIADIYMCHELQPERVADVLTTEFFEAIQQIATKWKFMAEETRSGIQANIDRMMANYSNSALKPFLTGLGTNSIEVGELWNKVVAFDLNMDDYGNAGKLVLLFVKTLINEEAVKRQVRFSKRQIQITDHFRKKYPNMLILETSPECVPLEYLSSGEKRNGKTLADLQDEFIELAVEVQRDVDGHWATGEYLTKLKEVANKGLENDDFLNPHVALAIKAVKVAEEFFAREPRFKSQLHGMASVNPIVFKKKSGATEEENKQREYDLSLYYEYENLKTRISREHFFFICDEYQELITNDPSGGCYTDANFPNISRSTNVKLYIATQTRAAFKAKIGVEVMENFLSQMRSRIYLTNDDKETIEEMVTLAGEGDVFRNPHQGTFLKKDGAEQKDYVIYDNFNHFISTCIAENKEGKGKTATYPYTYDLFAKAEPVDIDYENFSFDEPFSGVFNTKDNFNVASMKDHFYSTKSIPDYVEKGSSQNEVSDNLQEILQAVKQAKADSNDKYHSFLEKGYESKVKYLTETDIQNMGNLHAFISVQRCGVTKKDHIIISQADDYIVK